MRRRKYHRVEFAQLVCGERQVEDLRHSESSTQQTLSLPLGRKETLERSGDHTRPSPPKIPRDYREVLSQNGYGGGGGGGGTYGVY